MKTYGNIARVETEREYVFNYDSKTGNSLTVTYEVPEEKALSSLPVMGSSTSLLSGVILRKATVKHGEGGISSVRLEYGKPDEGEDAGGDNNGDSGSGGSELPDEDEEDVVEQSLDGSVNDEPLLSHPKAQSGINDAQREYLKAVQDGTRLWELVNELNEDGSPKKDKDGQPVMKPLKQLLKSLSDNGKEVLNMLLQGIHSYRSPGATFREARMVRSSAVNLDGLGKIGTPANAPTPSGRNWLLVGKSFSRTSSGKKNRWRVETIYELSGASGWNKKLYGN